MRRFDPRSLLVFSLLLLPLPLSAASLPVPNGDFENDPLADGDFNFGAFNWGTFGGVGFAAGAFNPTSAQYAAEAPQGSNVGWAVTFNSSMLIQTLVHTYQAGHTYTLTAFVGDRDDYAHSDFQVALFANNVLVSAGGQGPLPPEGGFSLVTATYDADESVDGLPIQVRLIALASGDVDPDQDPGSGGSITDFDDVRLDESPTKTTDVGDGPLPAFTLHPATPNPFRASAAFTLDLREPAPVRVDVFDASGRCVRRLANGEVQPVGRARFTWEGRDDRGIRAAAGVYLARVGVGRAIRTVRMVLTD